MTDGSFGPWLISRWLTDLVGIPAWAGLHFSSPLVAVDALATEVQGDRYARQPLRWTGDMPRRVLRSANLLRWPVLPPMSRIYAVAVWNAAYNGDLLGVCPLDTPLDFPAGGSYKVDPGQLFLAIDP